MQPRAFDRESCDLCGDCFSLCPVLKMEPERARQAIGDLVDGTYVKEVLDRCTGCMSCDAICEKGANPYGLLLEHYHQRYLVQGIPGVFRGAMPQRQGPNMWDQVERWFSNRERENLERWSKPPESEEVLFLGCNQRLTPYIADTRIFDGLEIFTDSNHCCGEYYLRLGLLEQARDKASSLKMRFDELGIKRLVAFCPACHNTIVNLTPRFLGIDYGLEVVSLVDWLTARVKEKELNLAYPVGGTSTVQDPCHASGLEPSTVENVRYLLSSAGLEVLEMKTSGAVAECCGIGVSLARYRLADVALKGFHRIRQTRGSGAEMTCAWCNGCHMVMNMFRLFYPLAPPVYHLIELLQLASGETPVRAMPARALQLLQAGTEATALDGVNFRKVMV